MNRPTVTDEELALVGPILQRLVWADAATRAKAQGFGVNVLPINQYANAPSLADVAGSYEYAPGAPPPYFDPRIFDAERFRRTLAELLPYAPEFDPPATGDPETARRFFWENGQFGYSDATAYYCFLRLARPANVVEIGSGFSTLVALDAVERNGAGAVHCIEPFPRPFLRTDTRVRLHAIPAQEVSPDALNDLLRDGDVLFIDSTHTVKTGSDCLHVYLRLLPALRRRVLVHVHDVFLPRGMPRQWLVDQQLFWTEQYLLYAFLLDNRKAEAVYGSAYNAEWHAAEMRQMMAGRAASGGGSFWFRYDGTA